MKRKIEKIQVEKVIIIGKINKKEAGLIMDAKTFWEWKDKLKEGKRQ
jgi:hypothetical protein